MKKTISLFAFLICATVQAASPHMVIWSGLLQSDLDVNGNSITNANKITATNSTTVQTNTAAYFVGDGHLLTGISGGGGSTNFIPLTNGIGNGTSITNAHDTVILGTPTPNSTGSTDAPAAVPLIIQGARGGDSQAGAPGGGGRLYLYGGDYGNDTNDSSGDYGDVIVGAPNPSYPFIQIDQFDQQLGIYNADIVTTSGRSMTVDNVLTGTLFLDAGEAEMYPDTGQLGFHALTYTADGSGSNATWTVNGGTNTALQLSSTTNFITFSQTNTAPASTNVFRWIAVSLAGDTNQYRMPLYK